MLVSMRILELSPDSMYLGILVQYALKFYYNVTHWKGCGGWVFCSSRCSSRVVVFWFAFAPPCKFLLPSRFPSSGTLHQGTINVFLPLNPQNLWRIINFVDLTINQTIKISY